MTNNTSNIWWSEEEWITTNTDLMKEEKWFSWITEVETTGEKDWTIIQTNTMMKQSDWYSNEMIKEFNEIGADNEWIAESYFDIANNATKWISTKEDWIVEVPDYWNRLTALKDISKMKWLFDKQNRKKSELPEDVIYVFN